MGIFDEKSSIGGAFGPTPKKSKSTPRNTLKGDELKILERQDHKCAICGKKLLPHRYHIDHKKSIALGGSNSKVNKQALCPDCHDRKTKDDQTKIAKKRKKEKEENKSFGGKNYGFSGFKF